MPLHNDLEPNYIENIDQINNNDLNIQSITQHILDTLDHNITQNSDKNILPSHIDYSNIGFVISISDNIVNITGLYSVAFSEMVEILTGENTYAAGMVLNIEVDKVSAIIFNGDMDVKPGQFVFGTGNLMRVPVGDALLGRIVDPLGNPLDSLGSIKSDDFRLMDSIAPSIISRKSVNTPLETGLKVIDSIVPIGHGQRELIIGDSKTGKTSIGIDSILNQSNTDTINIYVAIGQKRSSVTRLKNVLIVNNCLKSSLIVAATASDPASLQFIAPYCATSMGEY